MPAFVTGAVTDHLTPWKGRYQTTQLLGGPSTFVLSYSGHIASLVNAPGNPKAHCWTGAAPGAGPEKWLATAEKQQGSWWEAWASWVIPRAGRQWPAPSCCAARPGALNRPGLAYTQIPELASLFPSDGRDRRDMVVRVIRQILDQ